MVADADEVGRQMDLATLAAHYDKSGAAGTFLVRPCHRTFPDGPLQALRAWLLQDRPARAVRGLDAYVC